MGVVRFLPFVVEIALLVYCLIDCIQTDEGDVRNLSKSLWVILIIVLPIVGGVAWLVAGRPQTGQSRRQVPWPSTGTAGFPEYERPRRDVAPDDDPEFLAALRAERDRERRLAEWEAQLRDREEQLGRASAGSAQDQAGPPTADEGLSLPDGEGDPGRA